MASSDKKVVLITGGSDGMGKATAIEFAKIGHRVAITGRNADKLKQTLEEMVDASAGQFKAEDFLTLKADFEDPSQVEPVIPAVVDKFGRLDVLVNNAGTPGNRRTMHDEDFYEDFKTIMQVNLMAAVRLAHLAMPHLLKSKGVVVNVTSTADRFGVPTVSYSISKAGLAMLTKSIANCYDGTGVRVVTLAPGPIDTNFSSNLRVMGERLCGLRRAGHVQEIANAIVFVASEKASYIHGSSIDVDGGFLAKFGGFADNMRNAPPE